MKGAAVLDAIPVENVEILHHFCLEPLKKLRLLRKFVIFNRPPSLAGKTSTLICLSQIV